MSDTTTQNDNPIQENNTVLGSQVSDNQSTDWRSSLSDEIKNDACGCNVTKI